MLREKGKIVKWNDDKGYGFILPDNSQKNIFVHIKSFTDRNVRPKENQVVTYNTIQDNRNGKKSATRVSRSTDNPLKSRININKKIKKETRKDASSHNISIVSIISIVAFSIYLFLFTFVEEKLSPSVIIVHISMGIITYFAYAIDKNKAKHNEYRISEKALLILSLLGGVIGALIAQKKLRHKNKKLSFLIPFWVSVFINIIWFSKVFKI